MKIYLRSLLIIFAIFICIALIYIFPIHKQENKKNPDIILLWKTVE